MRNLYILKDKTPVPCEDALKWAEWMESGERKIGGALLGDVHISTVFLGVDSCNYPPKLFETIITGGKHDGYSKRYCTWEEAEKGFEEAVNLVLEI